MRNLFSLFLVIGSAVSVKILGLFPYKGKSHSLVMIPLLEQLARRGHEVTVISFLPSDYINENYTSIVLPSEIDVVGYLPLDVMSNMVNLAYDNVLLLETLGKEYSEVFANPKLQTLQRQKYDLVIAEYFNTDLFLGLVHKMNAPFIFFHTSEPMVWHRDVLGEPQEASYRPHIFSDLTREFTFINRLRNTLEVPGMLAYYHFFMRQPARTLAESYLGPLPELESIAKNASLYLVNTHFSINGVIPASPAVVEVAGIHVKPKKALPKVQYITVDLSNKTVKVIRVSESRVKNMTMTG